MGKEEIVLDENKISEIVRAISEDIIAEHKDLTKVVFVGILTNGFPLAKRFSKLIKKETGIEIPVGKLDVSLYRDDILSKGNYITIRESDIPFDLTGMTIILVDDVLFHGRTIRAALDGLLDYGRPAKIELVVLIDRGHRELPIYANYKGMELKTDKADYINVKLYEVCAEEEVIIAKK